MYPFVTIAWIHLELTGIGIILAFFVFMIVCRFRAQRMALSFQSLYSMLPAMIASIYFGWSYIHFLLETGHILPYTVFEFYHLLLPSNYQFHPGGMIIWLVLFLIIFINNQSGRFVKHKRIDCIYIGLMYAVIVLGIFLILGDDMIGLSTDTRLWIYALTPMSEVSKFNKVLPVWLFLSLAALLSLWLSYPLKYKLRDVGRWYGWFGTFLLLLWGVLLMQHYARHGVIIVGGIRYDINQYIARTVGLYCLTRYIYIYLRLGNKSQHRIITTPQLR